MTTATPERFVHPALFYRNTDEYLAGTVGFVNAGLAAGEPVLVSGKVSFPQRGDDSEDEGDAPREPTILMSEVKPLAEAVRADTRSSPSSCSQRNR